MAEEFGVEGIDATVSEYLNPVKEPAKYGTNMKPSMVVSTQTNPDKYGEAKQISDRTGVPIASVLGNTEEVERRNSLQDFDFDTYSELFPTSARILSDPEFAKLAHDDVENMGLLETSLTKVGNVGRSIFSGLGPTFAKGFYGSIETLSAVSSKYYGQPVERLGLGGDPFDDAQRFFKGLRLDATAFEKQLMAPVLENAGPIERDAMSGFQSMGLSLPGTLLSILTANPTPALTMMGMASGGASGARALDEGVDPLLALSYGLSDAAVEVGTERIPLAKFIGDTKVGSGFFKTLINQVALEVPTELLATTLQNLNEWAVINPDEPFSKYLEALPDAWKSTAVSTFTAVGAQTGAITLTNKAVERMTRKIDVAQAAEADAAKIEKMNEVVKASKVLERDPASFEKFIEKASENADIEDIYIDTNELSQSGIDINALAELSPSVRNQMQIATETGGLLKIPLKEYASKISTSDLSQQLTDVIRTDPLGMSRLEATEFMQSAQADFEKEVEKSLEDTVNRKELEASRQAVHSNIMGQLSEANRFTGAVNDQYATMMSAFYTSLGQRTGQTAEEMFEAFPVNIQAQSVGGDVLAQDLKDTPRNDLGLYSKLDAEVVEMKLPQWKGQGKTSGKAIMDKVRSLPVKNEEIEWTGIEEFLASGDKFSREDVLNFVRNNGVQVEETVADIDKYEAEENFRFDWEEENVSFEDAEGEGRFPDILEEMREGETYFLHDKDLQVGKDHALQEILEDDADYIRKTFNGELEDGVENSGSEGGEITDIADLQDLTDSINVIEWVESNFADQIDQKMEDWSLEVAEQEYLDNPLIKYLDRVTNTEIIGNDEMGYSIDGERSDIYSFGEAEIQAEDTARSNGEITSEEDELVAKWDDHIMGGQSENYREIKIQLPGGASFYNDAHFPDPNIVAFLRVDDRRMSDAPTAFRNKLLEEELAKMPEGAFPEGHTVFENLSFEEAVKSLDVVRAKISEGLPLVKKYFWENIKDQPGAYPQLSDLDVESLDGIKNIGVAASNVTFTKDIPDGVKSDVIELQRQTKRFIGTSFSIEIATRDKSKIREGAARNAVRGRIDQLQKEELSRESEVTYTIQDQTDEGLLHSFLVTAFDDQGNELQTSGFPDREAAENAVATAKTNTTITKKAKDNTYFIDEFQSDWHQQGRQEGYKKGLNVADLNEKANLFRAEVSHDVVTQMKSFSDLGDHALQTGARVYSAGLLNPLLPLDEVLDQMGLNEELSLEVLKAVDNLEFTEKEVSAFKDKLSEADRLAKQAITEVSGVSDAPFKGDAWIALGMKRALVEAANKGYDQMAWPDADVLAQRWSDRYQSLYDMQYNKKMPSIVKKLTKQKPQHFTDPKGNGYWKIDITPELRTKIEKESFALFQKSEDASKRGSFNPETSTITLLNAADLSTFLHEAGHFFLETMNKVSLGSNAPSQIKEDMQAALQWMGVTDLSDWNNRSLEEQREGHEQFARGFEAYLMEGKAPSKALGKVFQSFKTWLKKIYKEFKNLDVELNDEVRSVFDRLLASDDAIQEAEVIAEMQPLFKTAEEAAGLTEDEWLSYQSLGKEATETAKINLERRSIRDMKWLSNAKSKMMKRLQREANAKRKDVKDQVEAEVWAEPVNQARLFLSKGEYVVPAKANKAQRRLTTVLATEGEGSTKMSLSAIKDFYGENDEIWKQLPTGKFGYVSKDGLDPEFVAEIFGFKSADHLIQSLINGEDPKAKIAGLTDQRMIEQHADLNDPASLEDAVNEALHNEARIKFVATEVNALQKATGGRKILRDAARQFATKAVERLRVRDLKPSRYISAEGRAAKLALKAMKDDDLQTAAVHKRNQLVQMETARETIRVKSEVDKGLRYLKRFDKKGVRKSVEVEYLDQIDALLERFDLRKGTSLKEIDKRKALTTWITEMEANGMEPDIPIDILDGANRKHYKDMQVEEMRSLIDSVKQIEHLGKLKNKLLTAYDARTFNKTVDDLVESIEEHSKGRVANNISPVTPWENIVEGFKKFKAEHRKVASLARVLDGVKDGGAMWETFTRSMNAAGDSESSMREDATEKLAKIVQPLLKSGKMGGKGIYFPSVDRSLNRERRISIALNLGNEGNRQRLLDGENWTNEQIQPILDSITPEEAVFVQKVWDLFDSYRPAIGAKERRVYGTEPDWVQPSEISLGGVLLEGGYYPIKYDIKRSAQSEQFADAELAKKQMQGAYTTSTTRRSFTKSRAEEVKGRPINLSLGGLYVGLNEVIHDLAWHEWLIDANRLLRNKKLDRAIRGTYGAETMQQFKKSVSNIAEGETKTHNQTEKIFGHFRHGATIAGLGLNLSTALINVSGVTQSIVRIGPKHFAVGLGAWMKSPKGAIEEIYNKSDFMRLRGKTLNREINEIQSMLQQKSKGREFVDMYSFAPIVWTQLVVDTPTWLGAYDKALSEGNVEDRAVALADQAVIDSQSSGQVKDLSDIQRGSPLFKLFTTFYSYFNATFNLTAEQTAKTDFKDPLDVMRLAGDYLMLYAVPALLGTLIREVVFKGEDDPKKLMRSFANELIGFMFGTMVGLREIGGAVQAGLGTTDFSSYSGPAGVRFVNEVTRLGKQINQGEIDKALRKSIINVAGVALHLPSTQVNRTIDGIVAIMDGDTSNPLAPIVGAPNR